MPANAQRLHSPVDERELFLQDMLAALSQRPRQTSPKYFYDEAGSRLFDRICDLPEYYPTRTERGILEQHGADMARALGPRVMVVEPGSGSSNKVPLVLKHLREPAAYVPMEICLEHMVANLAPLEAAFPRLEILPVAADFTRPFSLPTPRLRARRRVVFFPGSTLGNFTPKEARELLLTLRRVVGHGGALLLGVDLQKPAEVLVPAYDDAQGVTAAFNLNLLERANRELGSDFNIANFTHRAVWNAEAGRIEMHLVSRCPQAVHLAGQTFHFATDEPIITEYSHKYTHVALQSLAAETGFDVHRTWEDERDWFSLQYWVAVD
ncbi:L-histidine N(alpha)-methyltransferase [Ectothiorhodospira marina]|uniref:Dimethylhistidine N-methyltransferase n=1 Tax=Ectothiorhodospira marina TaxID=1396821 RepID=A0A1H7QDG8_9GAMM|nr:L-histidine N(alpha)-methyltransferase [Ectothiorhodospira marina]SEL45347.1 dimethylhistidine N-methyltransferase [Ectothiorhodospira marina]